MGEYTLGFLGGLWSPSLQGTLLGWTSLCGLAAIRPSLPGRGLSRYLVSPGGLGTPVCAESSPPSLLGGGERKHPEESEDLCASQHPFFLCWAWSLRCGRFNDLLKPFG